MKREHVTAEVSLLFDEFWNIYPKRVNGSKYMAKQIFNKLVTKEGVPSNEIINGARGYAEHCRTAGILNTEYIAMAKTWLNQHRWEDYQKRIGPVLSEEERDRLWARYKAKLAAQ